MIKNILGLIVSMVFIVVVAINQTQEVNDETVNNTTIITLDELVEFIPTIYLEEIEPIEQKVFEELYFAKMTELETISGDDLRLWFKQYKQIIEESDYEDKPETLYDYYNADDLMLLFQIVQAEIGDEWSFIQKCNVASVIFNRVDYIGNEDFGDGIYGVLTKKNAFCPYRTGSYKNSIISEETILACEFAFSIKDTAQGCLFFDNNGAHKNNENLVWVFNDGAHNFYKLKEDSGED